MRRRNPVRAVRAFILVTLCLALVLGPPAHAWANINDEPNARSSTNPNDPTDKGAWWRRGWGNSLYPDISFETIPSGTNASGKTIPILGFTYWWSRDASITVDDTMNVSPRAEGPVTGGSFDLQGINADPPPGGWRYTPLGGETSDLEGMWYVIFRFYNELGPATVGWRYSYGVDLTPPQPVSGFTSGFRNMATRWSRRAYTWDFKEYDALSRTALYRISRNGKEIALVPALPFLPTRFMIEDLPAGKSTIGIQAVDRATNVSPVVTEDTWVDTDTPRVSIVTPAQNQWVSGSAYGFTASASDNAAVTSVKFMLDGVIRGVVSSPPYTVKFDTRSLAPGHHVVTAEARDVIGNTASDTHDFYVDNQKIGIGSVSDSPDPFYPWKIDGYKDYTRISWYQNEAATSMYVQFVQSNRVFREIALKNVGAGWNAISWNGRTAAGAVGLGLFYYRLVAYDRAGNPTITTWFPTNIRNYEIVRIGPDKVKIVPR